MGYQARQIESADEFLTLTREFRSREPISTQIMNAAAQAVSKGSATYESARWWIVESNSGVVGIAIHTAPHSIFLSPMPLEASPVLADLICASEQRFPGVNGPLEVVESFLSRCQEIFQDGISFEIEQTHLSYLLDQVIPPKSVSGKIRYATVKDRDLVLTWFQAFEIEAEVKSHDLESVVDRVTSNRMLYLWTVGDEIVSLAGHSFAVETLLGNLCRIGPVYTPPEQRKKGYASFLVAGISSVLKARGLEVMLYADAKNPDSNKVYSNIGFKQVGVNTIWKTTWN